MGKAPEPELQVPKLFLAVFSGMECLLWKSSMGAFYANPHSEFHLKCRGTSKAASQCAWFLRLVTGVPLSGAWSFGTELLRELARGDLGACQYHRSEKGRPLTPAISHRMGRGGRPAGSTVARGPSPRPLPSDGRGGACAPRKGRERARRGIVRPLVVPTVVPTRCALESSLAL